MSEEFGGSSSGSHSRHTESEESLVDDPMERDDIEEVVEPADPDLELKERLLAKVLFMFASFQQTKDIYMLFFFTGVEQVFTVVGPRLIDGRGVFLHFLDFSFSTLSFLHVCLRGMWMLRVGMGWGVGWGMLTFGCTCCMKLMHEVDALKFCIQRSIPAARRSTCTCGHGAKA